MSGQTVARIVDPSVEDWEDETLDDSPFLAPSAPELARSSFAEPEPAGFEAVEREMWPEPPTQPLGPRDVEQLLGAEPAPAPVNPVGEMIAGVEQAMGERSLPRIGVDVFALQASTREAAGKAAADRRFQRATTHVRSGGLQAALEHYATNPTPALVIVESDKTGTQLLAELDRLAESCDAGTKVVVVGAYNDIALYRELIRRGVSEYMVAPLDALGLIRTATGLFADPDAPFMGRTIAFVGAKGGVGASAIAHNIGYAISERMSAPTVIVDFDLPFGTAGLDFNQDPLQGVADALTQPDRLDATLLERMMVRCTDKLSLFAAPATLDSTYDIGAEAFEEVAAKIRTTAPFVIMDLPHIWSGWMKQTLLGADDVVIVATPDLASLRNAKNMMDLIRAARPNDAPPRLVLNQVGVPGRPEIPVKDFAAALGVEPSLVLPFDPKTFGQAANNGQMVLESGAKTKTAEGLTHLAHLISRREAPPQRASKSLLSGLLKKKA
jgi:pilus assembly protein CpaE